METAADRKDGEKLERPEKRVDNRIHVYGIGPDGVVYRDDGLQATIIKNRFIAGYERKSSCQF